MDQQPKRAPNFSEVEERLVLQLVAKYAKDVECKRSDTNTNKVKLEAWKRICEEFNSVGNGPFRDAVALRKKYENIKKVTKRQRSAERASLYKTGGGRRSPLGPLNDVDNIVCSIMSTQVDGLESEFDGDLLDEVVSTGDLIDQGAGPSTVDEVQANKIIILDESAPKQSNGLNWGKYTPDMLKSVKHDALNSARKGKEETIGNCRKVDLKSQIGSWAATKQLFVSTQEACFIKEHELTVAHKKEKHEQEMRRLEQEMRHAEEIHQEVLRQMREKHQRDLK